MIMPGRKAAGDDTAGQEPGPKRRRLLDAGGPIEDDETARKKMRDAFLLSSMGLANVLDSILTMFEMSKSS